MENTDRTKKFIAELCKVYAQVDSLSEQEKAIKEEIKAVGDDPAIISAVAKAITANKVDKLLEKSDSLIEVIELYRG